MCGGVKSYDCLWYKNVQTVWNLPSIYHLFWRSSWYQGFDLAQHGCCNGTASQENGWSCRFGTQRDRSVFKRSRNSRLLRDFFPRPINIHLPAANGMWNQDSRNLLQTNLWDRQQFECSRNSPFFGACWKYSCYTWALLNNGCFLGFPPKSRTFRSFPWANQPFQLRILATAHLLSWLSMKLHDLHCIWMSLVHLEQCIICILSPGITEAPWAYWWSMMSHLRSGVPSPTGLVFVYPSVVKHGNRTSRTSTLLSSIIELNRGFSIAMFDFLKESQVTSSNHPS